MNESEIQHQKIEKSLEFQYKNVRELLLHKTKANPNKTFLMVHGDETEEFTYLEFKNIVDKAVSFLLKNNLKKGDKISIIFHNSSDFLILYFAGLCSGLTLIPINPDMSKNEIEYIIKDSNSKAIFFSNQIENKINSIQEQFVEKKFFNVNSVQQLISSYEINDEFELDEVNSNDVAEIIYTSGTTGNPKGVSLSHLNLLSDSCSISNWFMSSR